MAKIPKVNPAQSAKPAEQKAKAAQAKTSSAGEAQVKDAFELVRLRNFYYRDGYRRLLSVVLVLALLLLASMAWVYYLYSHRPSPRYFVTNVHGGLIPLQPLSKPTLSNQSLINWAARAASAAFTVNYVQYRQQMENTKDTYFTANGAQQYQQQFVQSNDLATVINGDYVVVAQPNAAPTIIKQGIEQRNDQSIYAWYVNMPLLVTFHNPNQTIRRFFDVKLKIIRSSYLVDTNAPNLDGMKGIGIDQILVRALSGLT